MLLKNQIGAKPLAGSKLKLYYPKDQFLGFLFRKEIAYEVYIQSRILPLIQEGDIVFELGSNIGQYTLLLAERVGKSGQVIAVEPDLDNFAFLSYNCIKNNCQQVTLLHQAVADKEGSAIFYKDTATGGRMGSLIRAFTANHYKGKQEEVQVTTWKKLIDTYGVTDFVKVDVEGAEDLIFSGDSPIHDKTTFFVEVRAETAGAIFNKFHSFGFNIYMLEKDMQLATKVEDLGAFSNVVMRKGTL